MKQIFFTLEQFEEMQENLEGGCLNCGAIRDSCEPDARQYTCEECGEDAVYGAEELLIMGKVQ